MLSLPREQLLPVESILHQLRSSLPRSTFDQLHRAVSSLQDDQDRLLAHILARVVYVGLDIELTTKKKAATVYAALAERYLPLLGYPAIEKALLDGTVPERGACRAE
jgi:hypothetical protein